MLNQFVDRIDRLLDLKLSLLLLLVEQCLFSHAQIGLYKHFDLRDYFLTIIHRT